MMNPKTHTHTHSGIDSETFPTTLIFFNYPEKRKKKKINLD